MTTHVEQHTIPMPAATGPAIGDWWHFVADRFLLLPLGAAVALVWANTAAESYFQFSHAVAFAVNEIAMALFLALIAQEVLEALMPGGALHNWRRWTLPLVAAAGGVAGAAGVYLLYINMYYETVLAAAWPIATAIDVAAAYYVLKVIWRRSSALPFVLLMALATDAFGLLVLLLRPAMVEVRQSGILLILAALVTASLLRYRQVGHLWPYVAMSGTLSWFGLYLLRIHPALALLPIVPFIPREPRAAEIFTDPGDDDRVHHFEHRWNELVQVVLFFFGMVNAGVLLKGYGTATWGLLAAALIGRPLGIVVAVAIGVTAGLRLPGHLGWRELVVIALATSSGFTLGLFFASGLIPMGPVLAEVKLGALATVVGAALTVAIARGLHVGRFAQHHL
jgi:NhaA family Na+:H+ antiporter